MQFPPWVINLTKSSRVGVNLMLDTSDGRYLTLPIQTYSGILHKNCNRVYNGWLLE